MLAGAQRLGTNLRFGKEYTVLDSRAALTAGDDDRARYVNERVELWVR